MFLSKFMKLNSRSLPVFSHVYRGARGFCTTTSGEKGTTGKVIETEVNEAEKKVGVSDKEAPKKEEIIDGDFSFEFLHPYGVYNHKEKWITFYMLAEDGKKYKLRGYAGWNLLRALRLNRLIDLFRPVDLCDNGANNCARCHVRLDREMFDTLPEMDDVELRFVRYFDSYYPGSSRLGCRIELQKSHDGAILRIPQRIFKWEGEEEEDLC